MSTLRRFAAPSRYLQGPGALDQLGPLLAGRYASVGLLVDAALADEVGARLARSLRDKGIAVERIELTSEVTREAIESLARRLRPFCPAAVVAAGGGKTLDLGKGTAAALGVGVVTVPTIASNDGPTSRIIATYDAQHRLIDTPKMLCNPELVLVDTEVINRAPERYLLSGIGDALAKRFEAAGCARSGGLTPNGTRPLSVAGVIAEACFDTLVSDAEEALAGLGDAPVSEALERVVEAIVLMSGLAFENGGLSVAHALTRGLMETPGAGEQLHGVQVAYALLVQLVHEGEQVAAGEVAEFFERVGLPRSLAALGAPSSAATLEAIAAAAMSAPHVTNTVPPPTIASLVLAMAEVERAGSERSEQWT